MQLPIITEGKNNNINVNNMNNMNSMNGIGNNTSTQNMNNVNFNNWFRMESRTNLSGFLEDSEAHRKNNNGIFKKINEDNR